MSYFTLVDFLFIAILLATLIHGYVRGFALELITLVGLVVVGALALIVTSAIGGHFTATGATDSQPVMAFMFGGFFACGLLFALFIARKISGPAAVMGMGSHFIGALMGLLCGAVISVAVMHCVQFTSYKEDANWQNSKIVNTSSPYVEMITTKLTYSNLMHNNAE